MEAQARNNKKKGFMTPERKKKLRVSTILRFTINDPGFYSGTRNKSNFKLIFQLLLRKKAAEELKKEQERKSAERRKVIDERCGSKKSLDGLGERKFKI